MEAGCRPAPARRRRGRCRRCAAPRLAASRISSTTPSPVRRVERGGRLVEQQDRDSRRSKPRAMLTRCCSPPEKVAGGSGPQALGMLSTRQQDRARALGAPRRVPTPSARQRLGHDVERRHPRDDAQELADVAQGAAAHVEHRAAARRATRSTHALAVADAGSRPPRRGSCRRASAAACSCRRPTGRPAPRIRPRDTRRLTPRSTGSARPPWACSDEGLGEAGDAERRRIGFITAGAPRRRAAGCRDAADRRAPGRSSPSPPPRPPCITISRCASSRATAEVVRHERPPTD